MKHARALPLAVLSLAVLGAHMAALSGGTTWATRPSVAGSGGPVLSVRQVEAAPARQEPAKAQAVPARPERRAAPVQDSTIVASAPQARAETPQTPATPIEAAPSEPGEVAVPSGVRSGLVAVAAAAPQPPGEAGGASKVPAAFSVMGSQRLHYRVDLHKSVFAVTGKGELAWRQDGSTYEATLSVDVPLVYHRVQRSTGRITAEGLAPERFSDRSRNEEATHFVPAEGKVIFSSNQPQARWAPGMQDRLSVMLQLGAMMAAAPGHFARGAQISVETAGTRDVEPWLFTVDGEEALDLPGGQVKAVKLTRQPRKQYDVRVELWLAPGMAYAPVRLRLTQPNGDWVDQQWSSTDRG